MRVTAGCGDRHQKIRRPKQAADHGKYANDQKRNCGPKLTRRLLCMPLLKKMLSPISARTPIGPANASTPPPGYKAKYVALLPRPTALVKPAGAPRFVTVKFSNPTLPVTKMRSGPEP